MNTLIGGILAKKRYFYKVCEKKDQEQKLLVL